MFPLKCNLKLNGKKNCFHLGENHNFSVRCNSNNITREHTSNLALYSAEGVTVFVNPISLEQRGIIQSNLGTMDYIYIYIYIYYRGISMGLASLHLMLSYEPKIH